MLPEDYLDLLIKPNFANIATVKPDGSPHVTPVWIDYDEETNKVLINTAKGRVKHRNMEHNPKVSLSIMDKENPYRYLMIEGKVEKITEDGAVDHINSLAKKYMGKDEYPKPEGQVRLKIVIDPEDFVTFEG